MPQWLFPLFVLMWLGGGAILSVLSGWHTLASRFRAEQPALGERFRFASGFIGNPAFPVHYSSCLFVTVSNSGLSISIFFLFRFLTPTLFIPWSEVTSVELKQLLFYRYCAIRLRDQWPTICVRGGAGQRIAEVYASQERSMQRQLAY
jgi:hypothetical protein